MIDFIRHLEYPAIDMSYQSIKPKIEHKEKAMDKPDLSYKACYERLSRLTDKQAARINEIELKLIKSRNALDAIAKRAENLDAITHQMALNGIKQIDEYLEMINK